MKRKIEKVKRVEVSRSRAKKKAKWKIQQVWGN